MNAPGAGAGAGYYQQGHDDRGMFGNTQGAGYAQGGSDPYAGNGNYNGDKGKKDKEKKAGGHSTAMLAAAGVGGVAAGALVGHELSTSLHTFPYPSHTVHLSAYTAAAEDSSDDEHHASAPAFAPVPTTTYAAPVAVAAPPAFAEPPPVPTHDEDGSSISSSDRESMEEAREDLIEAQEEYQEELEENYED